MSAKPLTPSRGRLLPALWVALGLVLAALVVVAVWLLVKMDFFSGTRATDEQLKSLWAFLGVALGAVVTLIGTLLTEQHNRRTAALARQAERRLTVDTVASTLELLTEDGAYAKPARVGGAIATMMELEGGAVAIRILGDLWAADAVASDTAVWLINRVLEESDKRDELEAAADLLLFNVAKLVPAPDAPNQDWEGWPAVVRQAWPARLPSLARNSILVMAVRALLVREPGYWVERGNQPLAILLAALPDAEFRPVVAWVILRFHALGVMDRLDPSLDEDGLRRLRGWAETADPAPWFARLLEQFEPWLRGEDVHVQMPVAPASVSAAPVAPLSPS